MTGHRNSRWDDRQKKMRDRSLADRFVVSRPHGRKRKPSSLTLTGTCPFCLGAMSYNWERSAVTSDGAPVLVGQGKSELIVKISCTCPLEHAGRPEGDQGCGGRWTTTIEVS